VRHKAVSFNQLDDRNMGRIRYQKVSEETGEEVPSDQIVKAYEISKGRYVVIDPDELEPFIPAATKTIELEEFVDLAQIDPVYFEKPYYIAPHLSPKPYVLLARALESSGKVAIARFVMRGRQYTAAIRAEDSRLIMSTLAYADEVVPADSVEELAGVDDVDVAEREVKMAEMLVESLSADFDPTKFTDEYRVQVLDLIAKKAAGEEFELPATEARSRRSSTSWPRSRPAWKLRRRRAGGTRRHGRRPRRRSPPAPARPSRGRRRPPDRTRSAADGPGRRSGTGRRAVLGQPDPVGSGTLRG
jgi:DNA end-binding protein Ku